MPATYSLLAPSPPWASITSSGLLSIGVVPDAGFTGIIRVQAIDGASSATKDIAVNIQPKYQVVLDFVEVSDYVLASAIGGPIYESFEVQAGLDYVLNPAIGGAFYSDANYLPSTIVPMDIVIDMPIVRVLPSPIIPMSIVVDMPIVGAPTTISIPMDIVVGMPIVRVLPPAIVPLNIVVGMPIAAVGTSIVQSYTITAQTQSTYTTGMFAAGVHFPLTWARLNDSDFTTGVAVTSYESPDGTSCSLIFDLGSTLSLSHVQLSGGTTGQPLPFANSPYANGSIFQWSNDETSWTTFTTVSGVADNNTYTRVDINQSARYLRLIKTQVVGVIDYPRQTIAFTSFILHRFT